jgi:aryl-alcohol dehydrogenase-like predicted oxidoreductase
MSDLRPEDQQAVIRHAIARGINWFDTAAGYGEGKSESNLGEALGRFGHLSGVHIATKVRYLPEHLDDLRGHTLASVTASLNRLQVKRVMLLQLHNAVTALRGDEPTSITPQDVLGKDGVLEGFRELQEKGLVQHIGITGMGQPSALREVIRSGAFDTMQVPYSLLNPSAGTPMAQAGDETDYGNIIADCYSQAMGVFAIRIFAGGALLGNPPSAHTLKTPFFPLGLYERDRARAARLTNRFPRGQSLHAAAIRFALAHPHLSSAIIGFRTTDEIDAALSALDSPTLPGDLLTGDPC